MTRLESEKQYQAAKARVEELLPLVTEDTPEDDVYSVELVLLSNLLADYDDVHYSVGKPTLIDVLRLRMYEMNLTQKALAKLIGISSHCAWDLMAFGKMGLIPKNKNKVAFTDNLILCGRRDSNPHASRHQILSLARLPITTRPR